MHLLVDAGVDFSADVAHLFNEVSSIALELLGLEDTIVDELDCLPRSRRSHPHAHIRPYAHIHHYSLRLVAGIFLLRGTVLFLFFLLGVLVVSAVAFE